MNFEGFGVVVIIGSNGAHYTYENHFILDNRNDAITFQEGVEAAWKISHSSECTFYAYILNFPDEYKEWEEAGSPGKELIVEDISKALKFVKNQKLMRWHEENK